MLVSRKHHNLGFTLLELLVVISLLSILAVVGARAYRGKNSTAYFEAIVNALERAKFMAINEGHQVNLSCNEIAPKTSISNKFYMSCTSTLPSLQENKIITFFPDGSSSGGTITLRNNGLDNTIKIDWLTGKLEQN